MCVCVIELDVDGKDEKVEQTKNENFKFCMKRKFQNRKNSPLGTTERNCIWSRMKLRNRLAEKDKEKFEEEFEFSFLLWSNQKETELAAFLAQKKVLLLSLFGVLPLADVGCLFMLLRSKWDFHNSWFLFPMRHENEILNINLFHGIQWKLT